MKEYKESQSFVTLWLIVLFVVILGMEINKLYTQYLGTNVLQIEFSFYLLLAIIIGLFSIRLNVFIDESGIRIKFFPFVMNKKWDWADVQTATIVEYILMDYGGWGYRVSRKKGVAYTTKGKYGIQLVLKNGNRLLIGTQQPEEVSALLSRYNVLRDEG